MGRGGNLLYQQQSPTADKRFTDLLDKSGINYRRVLLGDSQYIFDAPNSKGIESQFSGSESFQLRLAEIPEFMKPRQVPPYHYAPDDNEAADVQRAVKHLQPLHQELKRSSVFLATKEVEFTVQERLEDLGQIIKIPLTDYPEHYMASGEMLAVEKVFSATSGEWRAWIYKSVVYLVCLYGAKVLATIAVWEDKEDIFYTS